MTNRVIYISTSDRSTFRKCRRLWDWSSPLRKGLRPLTQAKPLWLGSAGHHALEDFHGRKLYPNTDAAIDDYVQATIKCYGDANLPSDHIEDAKLMKAVLNYYTTEWLACRDPLQTLTVKGTPQVEVVYEFVIPAPKSLLKDINADEVRYRCAFDRVTIDDHGYIWINDHKFVTRFTPNDHLELDSQIGVYMWAARSLYGNKVAGFIYNQYRKVQVDDPRMLKDGTVSCDKDQSTTHLRYRKKLIELYGESPTKWPVKNVQCLDQLLTNEGPEGDKFIRRDQVDRNEFNAQRQSEMLMQELHDLLRPDTRIYPSPSFLCATMTKCAFMEPCLQIDKGEDYLSTLQYEYQKQTIEDRNNWRDYLNVKPAMPSVTPTKKPAAKVAKKATPAIVKNKR